MVRSRLERAEAKDYVKEQEGAIGIKKAFPLDITLRPKFNSTKNNLFSHVHVSHISSPKWVPEFRKPMKYQKQ